MTKEPEKDAEKDPETDEIADADVDIAEADEPAESTDDAQDDESGDEPEATPPAKPKARPTAKAKRPPSLARRLAVPVALAVLLLGSVGAAAWSYVEMYRPDRATDDAVAATVVQSASDGTVALLSYSPDTLDADFANAKAHLTGDFLNYYTQFTADIVTPAAKQKSVKTSAQVVRSALGQLSPTSAEVLLFINQSTTSKENPDGAFTASSVKVGLTKIGNDWLISSFDPV